MSEGHKSFEPFLSGKKVAGKKAWKARQLVVCGKVNFRDVIVLQKEWNKENSR